ncbi:monocarboxylate transporter 9-like [Rhipicephalus microplus]|uniref:monocarboxylate transporter 9-like n=1 Tax=Rhipicephalus microplus TaxID=6941 RepID=UPI003F6C9DFC
MRNRIDCRWDVVAVAMLTNLFAVATSRTMGWFYVAFIEEFGLNRQSTSWPGFLLMCCHRTAGLLVSVLHKHMSLFLIGLLGSFFAWGGMAVSAFAPSISWMSFTMGIVHGIGSGVVIQAHTVVVLQHFSKYRGIAAGFMFTANPVSAILFPAVLSALNDAFGLRGAVVIYGALIMNISALCPVLKEPPWIARAGAIREEGARGHHREHKTSIDSTGCDMKLLAKSDEPAATAFSNEKI